MQEEPEDGTQRTALLQFSPKVVPWAPLAPCDSSGRFRPGGGINSVVRSRVFLASDLFRYWENSRWQTHFVVHELQNIQGHQAAGIWA